MDKLMNFLKDEEGATAVEYGLLVALIAVIIIVAVAVLGRVLNTTFTEVHEKITDETGIEG